LHSASDAMVLTAPRARPSSAVAIIGGGAVGGWMAWIVDTAGHAVTLCVRNEMPALVVEAQGAIHSVPVAFATEPSMLTPVPWVLLATKAQDTASTAPWLARLVGPQTTLVVLQNGIDHGARIAHLAPAARLLPTVLYVAAERTGKGHIIHRSGKRIVVPSGPVGAEFVSLLAGSPVEILQTEDFRTSSWKKLLRNLAANPLTALTERPTGILRHPDLHDLSRAILTEALAVARAEGAHLTPDDVQATLDLYTRYSADGGTSMLHDRLAGRPLEHEYITGAVVDAARRHGLPVPLNQAILALLRGIGAALPAP
jgi:2-dehydropantoate 2-reductase